MEKEQSREEKFHHFIKYLNLKGKGKESTQKPNISYVGEKYESPKKIHLNDPCARNLSQKMNIKKNVDREEFHLKCITNKCLSEDDIKNKKNDFSEFYDKIIVGNKHWVELMQSEDDNYFNELAKPRKPKYLVIACSDSRVVVNQFTNTHFGDCFTQRNIGNMVISTDFNVQAVIQYAIEYLKVEHIMVIGH
jgi:hypothetical protein